MSLQETIRKVQAAVTPLIEEHQNQFDASQGLDYLHVKNSLLLSYLIDLVVHLRNASSDDNDNHHQRLVEMRTTLDKLKGMDAKLKYQIDKLLSFSSSAAADGGGFAAQGDQDDPLQFRPQLAEDGEDDDDDDSNGGSDDHSNDDDDDLALARQTVSQSNTIYKAPRLTAVPYDDDKNDKNTRLMQQQRRRQRAVAQALRDQVGDAPERVEPATNTTEARRFARQQEAKRQFEEDNFVRLTVSRQEKKDRKRLERQAHQWQSVVHDHDDDNMWHDVAAAAEQRGANDSSSSRKKKKQKRIEARNSYQEALFGSKKGGGKKGKKRK